MGMECPSGEKQEYQGWGKNPTQRFRLFAPYACLVVLLQLLATGCSTDLPTTDNKVPEVQDIGKSFDASQTGSLIGCVTWKGTIPNPPGFLLCIPKEDGTGHIYKESENPNRPHVNPTTRA